MENTGNTTAHDLDIDHCSLCGDACEDNEGYSSCCNKLTAVAPVAEWMGTCTHG